MASIVPDMLGFVVVDMGKALSFYRDLGLAVPEGVENEPYVEVIAENGWRLSWNALAMVKEIDPEYVTPVGYRSGLAFKCVSPADVDATYERMIALGHQSHKAPWDAFWGQRYAQLTDPDGNTIDLFAPLLEGEAKYE